MQAERANLLMAQHARSFAPAARLLGRADRDRVARLYALCRIVDDLADRDGSPAALARLHRVRAGLRAGGPPDPLATEAQRLLSDAPGGLAAFGDLVDGVSGDAGPVRIADRAALDAYAHSVAGTVGIMVCGLFEVPARHHEAAAALGRAMQLTNICRDVAEDARAGRRYLPADMCPHAPAAIAAGAPAARRDVQGSVAVLLRQADALYAEGLAAAPVLPRRLRLSVTVAAMLYRDIGHALLRAGGDPLQGRVRVPAPRKLWLGLAALPRALGPRAEDPDAGAAHA